MQIINKAFSIEEFKKYVDAIDLKSWKPQFPVVHNTSVPSMKLYRSWHDKQGWTIEQWGKNLASYYSGMGWNGCPHLFVCYDKILVLNPLDKRGTHTPSWNSISWGIETTAEFETEPFEGSIKDNLVAAVAILCAKAGFDPAKFVLGKSGIHFHKEDRNTTHKTCPGKNLVKADFVADVVEYMNEKLGAKLQTPNAFSEDHPHISEATQIEDTSKLTDEELTSVKWVQSRLNALKTANPPLVADGIVGRKTKDAVKLFQKQKWLTIDGIAGPVTRKALKAATK